MGRCFVISPVGSDDSPEREHAEDVFEFIIKPATDALGIHAYRADHTSDIGKVTEQMLAAILTEDFA